MITNALPFAGVDDVQAQRALVACSLVAPDRLEEVVGAMYEAFWVDKDAIQTPEVSLPVIADVVADELALAIARKVCFASLLICVHRGGD